MKEMTAKEVQDRPAEIYERHLQKDEESRSQNMKKIKNIANAKKDLSNIA